MKFAPSLKSVPGSWPTNITLQRDKYSKGPVFDYILTIIRKERQRTGATYSSDLSAVSFATGGSQVTIAVSFPGSATLSLDRGHLIFGGSVSEINR